MKSVLRRNFLGCAAALIVLAVVARFYFVRTLRVQLFTDANHALENSDYGEAEQLAIRLFDVDQYAMEARLLAGEAAVKLGENQRALRHLEPLLTTDPPSTVALGAAARIQYGLGDLEAAERLYRRMLEIEPQQPFATRGLAKLLSVEGRRWESLPLLFELLRTDRFNIDELLLLGNSEGLIDDEKELQRLQLAAPNSVMPLLGQARLALRKLDTARAEQLLKRIVAQDGDCLEAQARLGEVLQEMISDEGSEMQFEQWNRQLPPRAQEHPQVWIVRGFWMTRKGRDDAAARCFWEALQRDPNHQVATYQLSLVLARLRRPAEAKWYADRASLLAKLTSTLVRVDEARENTIVMAEAAELCIQLGRMWEASGWCRAILLVAPDHAQARTTLAQIKPLLRPGSPQVLDRENPYLRYDLAALPLPRPEAGPRAQTFPKLQRQETAQVRFSDVSARLGLDFQYFNGEDPDTEGRRMFEFTGGGVGVLDFDLDRWPDLYLPQGCRWPPDAKQAEFIDRLYRNLEGEKLEDVTQLAWLGDWEFSQGISVGDINDDGFPDVFVANVGQNRLYQNQGDGTFTDITGTAQLGGNNWTTSAIVADLSGDGVADLYEVNYLEGDNVFGLICNRGDRQRVCSPVEFPGQQDRFLLGLGNGTFRDATEEFGFIANDAKGLGAVVADFDNTGRLGIFVANDMTANSFFLRPDNKLPGFQEQAITAGVAYDRSGNPQACMGIAISDFNQDSLLDLFITNFYKEPNAYYQQRPDGYFDDQTKERGLHEPSLYLLGFGTQACDADLDGDSDILVTNGHIDDFTYQGIPYRMRPQFFRNSGTGFQDVPGELLGEYFCTNWLGRGLATLDYNRDGLPDFVVSHLDVPTSIVINETPTKNTWMKVRLVAVTSQRDAIGTKVRVESGLGKRDYQLTAGDGYMASNERHLVIGLADNGSVKRMEIKWPSGISQNFENLPVGRELMIVEGREATLTRW